MYKHVEEMQLLLTMHNNHIHGIIVTNYNNIVTPYC